MRNIRILLGKGTTNIKFDDPLIFKDNRLIVKSAIVLWDFNNLTAPTHVLHGTKKISFYNGYWTIGMIMEKLKDNDISSELLPYSCKIRITPKEKFQILKLGPLLGYPETTVIPKGGNMVSPNTVNINLGMKYVCIKCPMIDGTKTSFSGKRDRTACVLPITTNQTLKGSVTHYENINCVAMLDNGIYSELNFTTDENVGSILLEVEIL